MAVRNTDDLQVRGRAQLRHHLVQLEPGRAAAGQAEIAVGFAFHALEQPRHVRIVGLRRAPVADAFESPLHGKADAARALRGDAVAAPHAAVAAIELVVVLPRFAGPGPDAAFGAPDLQQVGRGRGPGDLPVKAVGAQVHQVSAAFAVRHQGFDHAARVVLRVRAGQHHVVGAQGIQALVVQVLVGDHVVVEPFFAQPLRQVRIRRKVPQARPLGIRKRQIARAHRQYRAQARRQADAGHVFVPVVGGRAELRHHVGVVRIGAPLRDALGQRARVVAPGMVRIGLVGQGRRQEQHARARGRPRRASRRTESCRCPRGARLPIRTRRKACPGECAG